MARPSCLAWPGLSLLLACSPAGGGAPVAGPSQAIICPEGKVLGRNNTCEAAAPLPPPSSSVAAAPLPSGAVFQPMPRPSGGDPVALRGHWFGEDSDGSAAYDLVVSADGNFSQTITTLHTNSGRSAGSCLQQGLLRIEGEEVIWSYERNTCNTDYEGKEDPDGLVEQDARHFVLQMEGYQVHYSRR